MIDASVLPRDRILDLLQQYDNGKEPPNKPHFLFDGWKGDVQEMEAIVTKLGGHVDTHFDPHVTTYVVAKSSVPSIGFILGCVCATVVNVCQFVCFFVILFNPHGWLWWWCAGFILER